MKYGYTKRGFTELGYDVGDLDSYWSDVNLAPYRPRILIYDQQDPSILLHEYNGFHDGNDNDLTIENLSCNEQLGTAGNFSFTINDTQRNVDRSKIGNANKIVISIAKRSEGPWYNILSGYSEGVKVGRDRYNGLRYGITGFGSGVIIDETLSDFRKSATRLRFGSASADPNDPSMTVKALMHYLLESKDHLVASPLSIKDQGGFDTSLISSDLDVFIPVISIRDQPISQAMNFLSDRCGSIWGVNANDQIWAWYPQAVHSGVTLKTFKTSEKSTDKIYNTSYFFGPWDYTIPIDASSFGNVLISHSGTEPVKGNVSTVLGLLKNESGTKLGTREVVQQFNMRIPDISMISVLLKKVGQGSLNFRSVDGVVYADNSTSSAPDLSNILATFTLDVSQLKYGVPTAVSSSNFIKTSHASMPKIGEKAWICLQAVGEDDDNTVMWLHSGDAQVSPENRTLLCGSRSILDLEANTRTQLNTSQGIIPLPSIENTIPFTITNNPFLPTMANSVYTFATFYNTKTRIIRKDPLSIYRYGQVERYIDVPWTTDFQTISDLLFLMLQYTAYPQMIYNTEKVSIPSPPFQSGKSVTVIDDISGLTQQTVTTALINSVSYEFNAYDLEYGIGTYFCDVNIGGIYDYLLYENVANGGTSEVLSVYPPPLI